MPAEQEAAQWGSDVVADFLRATGVPFVALNPGASFRGLHDSLVNHLGAERPALLLCLHEEHAVALAHGYAKVTGEPLAVAIHSNVGLMHASMAIYNAWADRVPVFIIGANGPVDASKRRAWIDWIHSSADQAAIVRSYVKWDDQPTSVTATVDALARAWQITRTAPTGPTYVVLDTTVQESPLTAPVEIPALPAVAAEVPTASAATVDRIVAVLTAAASPVVMIGRVSRDEGDWMRRVRLVEALGARVVTDLKTGASFPSEHPAHVGSPGFFLSAASRDAVATADAILALDWVDLGGTLSQAPATGDRTVIDVTQDAVLHNGWSKDHGARVPADMTVPVAPDVMVGQLVAALPAGEAVVLPTGAPALSDPAAASVPGAITLPRLARELHDAVADIDTCLIRLPLGWDGDAWPFRHPLDYLGYDGGGGIGSGPGMVVGAALALRGSGRLPLAVLGDGDYLMGVQALWTAAHDGIPFLAIVSNNRSYFNDEVHQEKVAQQRGRDVSRKWIGQRIDDPAPDLAGLARAQGLEGIGPVTSADELPAAIARGLELARAGRAVVIDVVVETGYSPSMAAGLTREG